MCKEEGAGVDNENHAERDARALAEEARDAAACVVRAQTRRESYGVARGFFYAMICFLYRAVDMRRCWRGACVDMPQQQSAARAARSEPTIPVLSRAKKTCYQMLR